jgi:hypothetical protein
VDMVDDSVLAQRVVTEGPRHDIQLSDSDSGSEHSEFLNQNSALTLRRNLKTTVRCYDNSLFPSGLCSVTTPVIDRLSVEWNK